MLKIVIGDAIRWKQYDRYTTESQKNNEAEFTARADAVDNVIDGPCFRQYHELQHGMMNTEDWGKKCRSFELEFEKCMNENFGKKH